jgi:hypothetical protein
MPRLPGTENWDRVAIMRTVNYLVNCTEEASVLSNAFSSTQVRAGSTAPRARASKFEVRNARMELITEAISLLLVCDDLQGATRFLNNPNWILSGHSRGAESEHFGNIDTNISQFVRLTLFLSLTGNGQMRASKERFAFSTSNGYLNVLWGRESEREVISVLPVLYFIAVASRSESETLRWLSSLIMEKVETSAHIDLIEKPIFRILGIYTVPTERMGLHSGVPFNPIDGFRAFREMEWRYASRIRQMREDEYHWKAVNPPGDLIDWSLLIAEVAALRSKVHPFPKDVEDSPEMRFCRDLASSFAAELDEPGRQL